MTTAEALFNNSLSSLKRNVAGKLDAFRQDKLTVVVDIAGIRQRHKYIVAGIDSIGATLLIPAATFAHIIIATTDAVELGSHLEDVDLYQSMVEMYVSAVKMP